MPSCRPKWFILAIVAVLVGVVTLRAFAPAPPRADAAAACTPVRGEHMFGDALLYVPKGAKAPTPLVIAFHGSHGYGPWFKNETGLSRAADRHGFAVLYPTASGPTRFWSLNRSYAPDDIGQLRALLPQVEQAACVNPKRIYATGVSNGGGFTARVGCEMADVIAAIAPVAGGYKALDPCPNGRRVSMLEIHGDADRAVPHSGRRSDGAGAVLPYLRGWARRDGCDATPVVTRRGANVTRYRHRNCDRGFAVEHLLLHGTDHGWPGSQPPFPKSNPSGLKAAEETWKFFRDKRLRSTA